MQIVSMIILLLAQISGLPEIKNTPVSEALTQCVVGIKLAQTSAQKNTYTVSDIEKELKTKKAVLEQKIIEMRGVIVTHTFGKDFIMYRDYIKATLNLSGNSAFIALSKDDIDNKIKEEIVKKLNEISSINITLAKNGIAYSNTNLDFFKEDMSTKIQACAPTPKPCYKWDDNYRNGVCE